MRIWLRRHEARCHVAVIHDVHTSMTFSFCIWQLCSRRVLCRASHFTALCDITVLVMHAGTIWRVWLSNPAAYKRLPR
jgi:hypothetical protein